MINVNIKGIIIDQEIELPIVILANREKKVIFPLLIGPFEANAIAMELKGLSPARPISHDLVASLFKRHRYVMRYLEIYDMYDDIYLARIAYRVGWRRYSIDVRPSDGIAIALRMKAPIMLNERVLEYDGGITGILAEDLEEIEESLSEKSGYSNSILYLDAESSGNYIM